MFVVSQPVVVSPFTRLPTCVPLIRSVQPGGRLDIFLQCNYVDDGWAPPQFYVFIFNAQLSAAPRDLRALQHGWVAPELVDCHLCSGLCARNFNPATLEFLGLVPCQALALGEQSPIAPVRRRALAASAV